MVCRLISSITVKAEKVGATKWLPPFQELGRQLVRFGLSEPALRVSHSGRFHLWSATVRSQP